MALFDQHGVKPRIAVRSGQWDFLAAMVQAGVGIAILPQPICQRLDKNTLRWLPLESELQLAVRDDLARRAFTFPTQRARVAELL